MPTPVLRRGTSVMAFLAIMLLFFSFTPSFSPVCLSPVQKDTGLIGSLKDVGAAYRINHVIDDQNELISLYIAEGDQEEVRPLLDKSVKTCQSLKGPAINNDTVRQRVENYLDLTIRYYQTLKKDLPDPKECKKQADAYNAQRDKYFDYLVTHYDINKFVHLTEDKYWSTMDKKKYIRSPRFDSYEKIKQKNLKRAVSLLDSIASTTTGYQEKVIYKLELADQYVKNTKPLGIATEVAIKKYKSILDEQQYCLYLYETWLKWRTVTQQNNGLSKSSDIPNIEYDQVRKQVAGVILDYIRKNKNDEMAINQFLVITTHDIIFRFGKYPYGNQNTIEYHQIFDN